MKTIPYARQQIDESDINAVASILNSDWLTQGPTVDLFERAVAKYCDVQYAVAVNSATSALHISCLVAGLGPGDIMWTSPNSFVASANCGLYCGANVDFVDIDPQTYNMCPQKLEKKLKIAKATAKMPKVVIPVHFSGQSCDMKSIEKLAEEYDFSVIEDASHAIGASFDNSCVGSCKYSDMTVFSFHPVKIITTGEGGMVLTNRRDLYERLMLLRSHGITRNPSLMSEGLQGQWYYEQLDLGYNYRMTDIQAALGLSQMQKIDTFISRRRVLAERYSMELSDLPLILPSLQRLNESAWHLYVILVDSDRSPILRKELFDKLREENILVNVHYIPIHLQPYYKKLGFNEGDFPNAEKYYCNALSLPMYAGLSDLQQTYVINTLHNIFS